MTSRPNIDQIIQVGCDVYGVTPEYAKLDTRRGEVVWIRQALHYWARKLTPLNLEEIGKHIGNRDHATVLHSVKCVEREYGKYEDRTQIIDAIEGKLKSYGFSTEKLRRYE